jgi:hypothetical protein
MGETVMAQAQVGNYFDVVESEKPQAKVGNYFDSIINPNEQRGRNLPSPVQGAINAISQAPFGIGDEVYGAMGGLRAIGQNAYRALGGNVEPVDVKATYLQDRDFIRGAQKQYSEDYPWTAGITGAMAGAPLMVAAPFNAPQLPLASTKAQKMANAAKLAWQAAKTGAVMGGAYGLGTSEGKDIKSVATDTAKGAGVGAVAGAVLQPTLSAVGGLSKNLLIRAFGDVKNTGGINQSGGQVGAIDPFAGLPDKTRQWMQQQGDVKIAEAIEQTGRANNNVSGQIPYSTVLANKVDKMPVGTPLAALSGNRSNELRSLDAISLLSGRTAPSVVKVQDRLIDTASKRFLNGVNKVMGNGSPDFNKSITALKQKATLESKPFYDILKTTNVTIDDEVRDLVNRSASYAAKANKMAKLEGEEFSNILKFVNPASGKTEIPLLQLERLKRAMNGAMKVAKREGDDEFGRSILSAKNALMDKLERSAPLTPQGESVYRLANSKFAEPKQLIDAVEEGANIFKKNHMDIRDERALLNAPELEAYNIGVFRALEEKLGSPSGRNFLTDITKNRNTAKQLYETLGHAKYRQLVKILKGEKTLKSIYTVNTGSQTANREAALSELGLDPLKDAGESAALLMSGSPVGAVGKATQAWNKIAVPEQVRDYMGQQYLLTGKQSQDYLKTLGQMIKQIQAQKVQSASRSGTLGALSTSTPRQDKNQ